MQYKDVILVWGKMFVLCKGGKRSKEYPIIHIPNHQFGSL